MFAFLKPSFYKIRTLLKSGRYLQQTLLFALLSSISFISLRTVLTLNSVSSFDGAVKGMLFLRPFIGKPRIFKSSFCCVFAYIFSALFFI